MASHLLSLGVVLLLVAAATGTAAFGLPRGMTLVQCAYKAQQYDVMLPLWTGNTTAIHIRNTQSCVAGYGGLQDPETTYQFYIPSWVTFTDNGTLVGEEAKKHAAISPGTAISGFMRIIGLRMYSEMVKREAELVGCKFTSQSGFSAPLSSYSAIWTVHFLGTRDRLRRVSS